ncbi:MAG: hypothetical protein J3Q66DRAFT_405262 [Benniella sp.]|nr:MAG: hypothetical protein J3Q66DRAFT_405262 [Benniella sp.]
MHPQRFFQVPQTSSPHFIPMDHGLQQPTQSCTTKSLPSVNRQVQLDKSAHKGQQNTNYHLVTEPLVASQPIDKDQAMAFRKTKDKMARKPLTEAEKTDIINRSGQEMARRHSVHEGHYSSTHYDYQRERLRT